MSSASNTTKSEKKSGEEQQNTTRPITPSLKTILKDADWNISEAQKKFQINTIVAWFYRLFNRDFDWKIANLKVLIIEANLISGFITFLLAYINQYREINEFSNMDQIIIYGIGGISVLISGIFVDALITKKSVYQFLSIINLVAMLVLIYYPSYLIQMIFASILSLVTFFQLIMFFTHIVSWTTLLDRGRCVSLIIFLTGLFTGPYIIAINFIPTFYWAWIPIVILAGLLIYFEKRNPPVQIGQIKTENAISLKNFVKIIIESNILSYILFFSFASSVLGFYIALVIQKVPDYTEIIITVVVVLISFVFIGGFLDNYGRKPIIIFTCLIVCGISLFSDYPTPILISEGFETFRFVIFVLSGVIVLILAIVLAGDNATYFRRGRIIGLFIFSIIVGAVAGVTFINTALYQNNLSNYEDLVKITDWITFIIIFAILFISRVQEPFDKHTPKWRNYLNKLYLMHNIGVGIYAINFKTNTTNHEDLNEDLVSGGLLGIESMITEIAETKSQIEVLDHGSQKLIFHHGKYSVAVLFVEKDLVIFREKLAGFHESFENLHEQPLQKFSGNITTLSKLDDLKNHFFD